MKPATVTESALGGARDRTIAGLGLAILSALAWAYNIYLARTMAPMPVSMPGMTMWTPGNLIALWLMWSVMMMAMMLPSLLPTVLTLAAMEERRRRPTRPAARAAFFVLGYVALWAAFCVCLTLLQWALHSADMLSPMMVSVNVRLSGIILILAGIFQFSPFKQKCLSRCRSPLGFLMTEWRDGLTGSAIMGFRQGAYCVGCCWLLMALLFVVGVMNLLWIGILSAFVIVEKMFPAGAQICKVAGMLLLAWGAWLLF